MARKFLSLVVCCVVLCFLPGCIGALAGYSTGTELKSDQLAKLHKGMTREEVIATLGSKPDQENMFGAGKRMMIYMHRSTNENGWTPVTTSRNQVVNIMLNAEGIVEDFTVDDKSTTANMFTGSTVTDNAH